MSGNRLMRLLKRLFGKARRPNGQGGLIGYEDLTGQDPLESIQNGEVQVVREQSYTDLWLASLGSGETKAKSLVAGGKVKGKKKGGEVGHAPSYTEMWMQSLAPPAESEKTFTTSDRLVDGAEVKDGDYKVLFQVERPGLGSTYLVSHKVLDGEGRLVNKVAVMKRYRLASAEGADAEEVKRRFESEAERLDRLDHPQIIKLLDSFVEGSYGYLVHQYVEGFTLKKQIKQLGPLDEKVVLGMFLQMCDLVHYLHSQSPPVVHIEFGPETLQMWR
ncbi:MAG TPA: protein kinase, partial [Candidatus Obscuribacterales bacterium]